MMREEASGSEDRKMNERQESGESVFQSGRVTDVKRYPNADYSDDDIEERL